MPEINVVPSAAPAAGNALASGSVPSADGQAASTPFAAVLQQQMTAPAAEAPAAAVSPDLTLLLAAAAGAKAELPAADALADPALAAFMQSGGEAALIANAADAAKTVAPPAADATAAATDLAALLPMLLGAAGLAGSGQTPTADKAASGRDKAASDEIEAEAAVLALPITAAVQTMPAESTAQAATPAANAQAAPPAASLSANLAAAADADKPADHGPQPEFESVLAASREAVAAQLPATAPAVATAPAAARIETPVGAQGWDHEVGNHVAWMANRQESRAELVLTPPQLGRIEISLSMSGDQANATFVSASPTVREALENALPRLHEILADAGVTLGQAQVGAETPRQWANGRENGDNPSHNMTAAFRAETESPPVSTGIAGRWSQGGRGMVDVFA